MSTSAGVATAVDEGTAAAQSETAGAQAAILVVSHESGTREILHRELSKRYGADYQIVACHQSAELAACMRDLQAAGLPVALVIGGVGAQDPDGIEVLAAVRAIDPAALRVAVVGWGDWQSARSVFDAVTLGILDHWVNRPVQAPAEDFHHSVTEFLREWGSQRSGGFEAAQVIGERWSARSQELRDLFARHRVPAGFYDATSGHGRRMLRDLGLQSPELPVVVLRFAAERPALVNPSNQQIADAFGIMRPISPGRAGRGGLRAADFAPDKGPLLGWYQPAGIWGLAAGVPADHDARHCHPRRRVHRARRDPDRGHGADHAVCDSVQGHTLLSPPASPAQRQDGHQDGQLGCERVRPGGGQLHSDPQAPPRARSPIPDRSHHPLPPPRPV